MSCRWKMKMTLILGLAGVALASSAPAAGAAGVELEHQAVYNQLLEGPCGRSSALIVHGGHGTFGYQATDPEVGGLLAEPLYEDGQEPVYEARVSGADEVTTTSGSALRYTFAPYESSCSKWGLDEPQLHYSYKTSESVSMKLLSKSLQATAAIIPKEVKNPRFLLRANRVYPVVSCNSIGIDTCSGYITIKTKLPLVFRGRRHRVTLTGYDFYTRFQQLSPMTSEHVELGLSPPNRIHFVSREQENAYIVTVERAIYRKSFPVEVSIHYRDEHYHRRVVTKTVTLIGPRHHAHCACEH